MNLRQRRLIRLSQIAVIFLFMASCAMNSSNIIEEKVTSDTSDEQLIEAKALYKSLPTNLPLVVRLNIAFIFLGERSLFQVDNWHYKKNEWKKIFPQLEKLASKHSSWLGFKQRIMPAGAEQKIKYLLYRLTDKERLAPILNDSPTFDEQLFASTLGKFYVCAGDLEEIWSTTAPLYQARIDVPELSDKKDNHPIMAQMCPQSMLTPEKEVIMLSEFKRYSTIVRALDQRLQPRFVLVYKQ